MISIVRKILFFLASIGLALMVCFLFLQVIARELHWAVDWTEELGRYSFISMVFIAAAYGTLTRSHLQVTVVSDLLARYVGRRVIDLLHSTILLAFAVIMSVYSFLNIIDGIRYPNISPSLEFNQNYLFISMSIGFVIIACLHFLDLIVLLKGGELNKTAKEDVIHE